MQTFLIPDKVGRETATQFYIAVCDSNGVYHGIGIAEGYWRTLMEARNKAKRFIDDGFDVHNIIRVTADGREYLSVDGMEGKPAYRKLRLPNATRDETRYYLGMAVDGVWVGVCRATGVEFYSTPAEARREAKALMELGARVDRIVMADAGGWNFLDIDIAVSPAPMITVSDRYPDFGSW